MSRIYRSDGFSLGNPPWNGEAIEDDSVLFWWIFLGHSEGNNAGMTWLFWWPERIESWWITEMYNCDDKWQLRLFESGPCSFKCLVPGLMLSWEDYCTKWSSGSLNYTGLLVICDNFPGNPPEMRNLFCGISRRMIFNNFISIHFDIKTYRIGPPRYVCWFINHEITPINYSYIYHF